MSPQNSPAVSSCDLTVSLGGNLILPSPFLAASGAMGFGNALRDLTQFEGLGALITPSLTLEPRPGSPMPRTAEASAGLIHSTGLPNPGLEIFMRDRMGAIQELPCAVIASIAARSEAEWSRLAGSLTDTGSFAGIELNLAWLDPAMSGEANVSPLGELEMAQAVELAVRAVRGATTLPIIAKIPSTGLDPGKAARIAVDAGADVVSASQAFPAVAIRLSNQSFRLPGIVGGLSGPAIKPLALYQVWRVRQSIQEPIVGSGGIMTAEDALEFMIAGATAVSIGVANYVHPTAIAAMAREMRSYLSQTGFASLAAFQKSIAAPQDESPRRGASGG